MSDTPSRYDQKREQILQAATGLINERGAAGMTMREVAQSVGLTSATLAYYFKGKEELANAVFERRLQSFEGMVAQAGERASPPERIETLLALEMDRLADQYQGRTPPMSALPSFDGSHKFDHVHGRVQELIVTMTGFLARPNSEEEKTLREARAYMFIGLLFFMPTWLRHYPEIEFPRIRRKIMELLHGGIAVSGSAWDPQVFDIDEPDEGEGGMSGKAVKSAFLRAATRLLNVKGYLGTSVDDIAEELNVTKGSFYHHFESKDDLVVESIAANFRRIDRAISNAKALGGSELQQICSAVATVLDAQFTHEWPLLRSTAFASLPQELRADVQIRFGQTVLRFAGSLIDGIAEGSVLPIDPLITSHVVNSTLYSALGLQEWASHLPRERAVALYASTLMHGIFDPMSADGKQVA